MDIFSQIDQQLSAWIDAHQEEIIARTQGLLHIPSVKGEPAPGAPFGAETRQALDYVLEMMDGYGFETKNLDGYAGHAEWRGENVDPSAEIVGVLAHVDIVPAGDGWKHPPFAAEIDNGILYARGAIDDKGPAMAAAFALVALKECGVPVSQRLRLILGADEESGFGCVKHYFAHEEMPATGFTPDGMFPLVYAEKGIANITLNRTPPVGDGHIRVVSLSGGRRANMVPDFAEAILEEDANSWVAIQARLNAVIGIKTELIEGGKQLRVTARGVSAHGSTPEHGVNALGVLCDAILLLDHQDEQIEMIQRIHDFAQDITGTTLGIAGEDEIAGALTSNLGIVSYNANQVSLTFNIRYPVTWNLEELRKRLLPTTETLGYTISEITDQAPLFVPVDDPLIQTLLTVYRSETGDETPPITIGGGTYARAMRKGVAFGPAFPGADGGAHQADESWPVEHLIRAAKIYAKAIARLAN